MEAIRALLEHLGGDGAELIRRQGLVECFEPAKDQRLSVAGDEPARLGQLHKVGDGQPAQLRRAQKVRSASLPLFPCVSSSSSSSPLTRYKAGDTIIENGVRHCTLFNLAKGKVAVEVQRLP